MKGLVAPGRPLFVACGRTKLCSQVWWCMPSAAILIFGGAQEVDELVLGCVAMRREARSLQHESKSLALGSGPAFHHDARDLGQVSLWLQRHRRRRLVRRHRVLFADIICYSFAGERFPGVRASMPRRQNLGGNFDPRERGRRSGPRAVGRRAAVCWSAPSAVGQSRYWRTCGSHHIAHCIFVELLWVELQGL